MPEQQTKKDHFRLNGGLNTEASEVSFPDGYTTDEANYELLLDGSRRRRKGLAAETGGATLTTEALTSSEVTQSFLWKNVGGDPTKRFWVHKIESHLYFSDDTTAPSSSWHSSSVDLDLYNALTTMSTQPVDFTSGKGELFVAGANLSQALRISYDSSGDVFDVKQIDIQIRDFRDIDDGVPLTYTPPDDGTPAIAEIDADHYYNLTNRGWRASDIITFATDVNSYPSKNMAWHRGYRRQTDVSYSDLDGIQVFNSSKLQGEAVGNNSSAPLGSLFVKVSDDTYGFSEGITDDIANTLSDLAVAITLDSADPWELTIDENGHSHSISDTIQFHGIFMSYNKTGGGSQTHNVRGGVYTVTGTNANDWTINFPKPTDYSSIITGPSAYWYNTPVLSRSTGGGVTSKGPKAIEFHESRLWYAGVDSTAFADHIFFSQIAQSEYNYNRCHMQADPTDPNINTIVASDGGYIVVPNIGNVLKLVSTRSSLLVFSDQGVWEVSGTRNGAFSPTNYTVRQITDAECTSPYSPVRIDNNVFYTGPKGVYAIGPNQYTGVLEAVNASEGRIQTVWNKIGLSFQPLVKTVYDDAKKRLYFLTGGAGNLRAGASVSSALRHYNIALVLDLRLGSWYKYEFNSDTTNGILGAFAISGADDSESAKKVKFLCQTAATTVTTCDLDQTDYIDFDGSESPLPYMVTGWDNIGDFQRRRQAPVITVYAKRTETGYTATGNGYDPVNESSSLLTAYWDWTDDSVSGKIGSQKETYRHVRGFVPSATDDVDGYPVVVTRNKVRGRGRVLQLRFDGAATKDSYLLGFSTNYKVTRGV
jgi:hypothetical protein